MRKIVSILGISFLALSCGHLFPKEESSTNPDHRTAKIGDQSSIGRTNYAVIWTWTTTKPDLVSHHLPAISEELIKLWKNDVIENAYFDTEAKSEKLGHFANIAFFLKASSISEARAILNELTVVKQGIATYVLRPVGLLWLDRKTNVINEKGITNSYVTVWKTHQNNLPDTTLKLQTKEILQLWNAGTIENVYFDIEGTQAVNATTDFVFFVNANSKNEAEAICNALPFFQENIATYEVFRAGVFWMGKYGIN